MPMACSPRASSARPQRRSASASHHGRWWRSYKETAGELHLWRQRAGLAREGRAALAAPIAAELGGDARGAAAMWTDRGHPYEAALALGGSDDEAAMREGLAELQALGARTASALVPAVCTSAAHWMSAAAHARTRGPTPPA